MKIIGDHIYRVKCMSCIHVRALKRHWQGIFKARYWCNRVDDNRYEYSSPVKCKLYASDIDFIDEKEFMI